VEKQTSCRCNKVFAGPGFDMSREPQVNSGTHVNFGTIVNFGTQVKVGTCGNAQL